LTARRTLGAGIAGILLASLILSADRPGLSAPTLAARAPTAAPSAPPPSRLRANGWTNLYPTLSAISALAATDIWVAGDYGHLSHYQAGGWQVLDPPVLQGLDARSLSMVSPSAGWLAATDATGHNHAFRYDGSTWQEHSSGLDRSGTLTRVVALAPDTVWGLITENRCSATGSAIMQWTGTQWTLALDPTPGTLVDLAMRSPTEGWAVGTTCGTGGGTRALVRRWDGTGWSVVPPPTDPTLDDLTHVTLDNDGGPWVVGRNPLSGRQTIYQYQGAGWSAWPLPGTVAVKDLYMADATHGWLTTPTTTVWQWDGSSWTPTETGRSLRRLAGSDGQVWAVGAGDTVAHWAAPASWTVEQGAPTGQTLRGVAAVSGTEAWAVGDGGTILHGVAGIWTVVPSATTDPLYAIVLCSPTEGYAAGGTPSSGRLLRWDGQVWTTVLTTATVLRGLAVNPSGVIWVVGSAGRMWQGRAAEWTAVASGTGEGLEAVAFDTPAHGWAVGGARGRPVVLEYTSGSWVLRVQGSGNLESALTSLSLVPDGSAGWAVGTEENIAASIYSTIGRLTNGVWTVQMGSTAFSGVAADSPTTAWAVGSYGAGYYSGGWWQEVALPSALHPILTRLALLPGIGGWAVGSAGAIFRYDAPPPSATATPTPASTNPPSPTATLPPIPPASGTATGTASRTGTATPTSTATQRPPSTTPTMTETALPTTPTPILTATSTPACGLAGRTVGRANGGSQSNMRYGRAPGAANALAAGGQPRIAPDNDPCATPSPTPPVAPTPTATGTSPQTGTLLPTMTATATPTAGFPSATPSPATRTVTALPPMATRTVTQVPPTGIPPTAPSAVATSPTATRTGVGTATPCTVQFSDMTDPAAYYYQGVYALACRGVISGYSDGTFRPFNQATRAQMIKIVTLAFAIPPVTPPAGGTFADVDSGNVFYGLIETGAARGIVSGYGCGGVNPQTGAAEPCDSAHRPYFRPSNSVTRGQLAKIVVIGAGWIVITPSTPSFTDVAPSNVFYPFIATAVCHGAVGGYNDGTFRPHTFAFRSQIAKIVYLAVTNPPGTCPAATLPVR